MEKPRFQYGPVSQLLQDVNSPGWAEKVTKEMKDIRKEPPRKVIVKPKLNIKRTG